MCVCVFSIANPLLYYVLRVPRKVDIWVECDLFFDSCTTWADHITCGTSICIVYWRKLGIRVILCISVCVVLLFCRV